MIVENLQLVDFNDLFVIAIGMSMAYVVVEKDTSFFSILSHITALVKNMTLRKKMKPQQQEEAVISRINFYLNSGLLPDTTRGALNLVSKKAEEVMKKIQKLEKWSEHKLEFHTRTYFLNVISCDCFFFGLFSLFVGTFQHYERVCIDGLMQVMLLTLILLLVHCLVFEHLEISGWKSYAKPRIILHCLLMILALYVGITFLGTPIVPISCGWLAIISVIGCFIGFIAYFIMNIIANITLLCIIISKIIGLDISSEAKGHTDDINRYKPELDKISEQLKNENLIDEINVTAGNKSTYV